MRLKKLGLFVLFTVTAISFYGCVSVSHSEIEIDNPYNGVDWSAGNRHKANFHTHTKRSDGKMYSQKVIDTYHSLGYKILALTDHNKAPVAWTQLAKECGKNYEDRDPGKLGMLSIPGNELSRHHHMCSLWCDHNGTKTETASLDAVKKKNGQAMLNHPGRYKKPVSWYVDLYNKYDNLVGQEIYNQGDRYKNDRKKWDEILTEIMPQRPVWGVSNDDMHQINHLGRNWNVFMMEEITEQSVRKALTDGKFYFVYCPKGHNGAKPPKINSIDVDKSQAKITIDVENADRIEWISDGKVICHGPSIELPEVEGAGKYVRAMIYGPKDNTVAGTQPFGIIQKK